MEEDRFAVDSPVEGAGFEPSVPLEVLTVGIVPCRLRGPFHASLPKTKFAADSALEGTGFEPSVPLLRKALLGIANRRRRHERRSHLQVQVRNGNAPHLLLALLAAPLSPALGQWAAGAPSLEVAETLFRVTDSAPLR